MKYVWIKNDDASELLIFCNGWGMDAVTLAKLDAGDGLDVLILYDYTYPGIDLDLEEISRRYTKASLVAWSLGVWAAAELFKSTPIEFADSIAYAGTLEPCSDKYGIPVQIFEASMRQWNVTTRKKFERRICSPVPEAAKHFATPERLPAEQCAELLAMRARMDDVELQEDLFKYAVVCGKDHIFPGKSQLAAWKEQNITIIEKPWPHYPFYNFKSWRDLVNI
jgi:pimeloyl-[acyl-carrier protein] methyl ester esterase